MNVRGLRTGPEGGAVYLFGIPAIDTILIGM
jgi:hypothetical protein